MENEKRTLNRREFLTIAAMASAGAAVAACAPRTAVAPTAPAAGPATPLPPTTVPPTEEPRDLTLLLVDWNDAFRTVLENEIIPAFQEANPGLTVLPDYTDWGGIDAKVMTAVAGGIAPDVFMADNVELGPKYYAKGITAELDPFVAVTGAEAILADFYPKAIDEGCKTPDGKLVALPYWLENRAFFYRKDFMAEVGLDPDKPPTNWTELRDAAIKLTKRTDDTFERAGFQVGANFQNYVIFLWQNNGVLFNETNDRVAWNRPEGIEALEYWVGIIRDDKVGPVENMQNVGDLQPFAAGLKAMAYSGSGTLANVGDFAPEIWDSVGVSVMGQKVKASLWYANAYLIAQSDHVEQSWKLLSSLVLDDDNFLKYTEAMQTLSPRKSIAGRASFMTPLHMVMIEDVMNAPGSHTTPSLLFSAEVLYMLNDFVAKAMYGELTPKEALDQAADAGNQIIARVLSGG